MKYSQLMWDIIVGCLKRYRKRSVDSRKSNEVCLVAQRSTHCTRVDSSIYYPSLWVYDLLTPDERGKYIYDLVVEPIKEARHSKRVVVLHDDDYENV